MKITYTLYSNEHEEGTPLAVVHDMSQANVLEGYYSQIYNNDRFKVMVKYSRTKQERVCGYWR